MLVNPKATAKPQVNLPQSEGSERVVRQLQEEKEKLEKQYRRRVLFQMERVRREEKELYSERDRALRLQLQALREELRQLLRSAKTLKKQVEVAVSQPVVEPGVYHLGFFERLRNWVKNFIAQIEEANLWLEAWNQKAEKRKFFWRLVTGKKGGAKFLLSSEHYLARNAG